MNCKELNKSTMKIHTLPLDAPKKFMDFRVASWKSFFVNGFKLREVHHMLLSVRLGTFHFSINVTVNFLFSFTVTCGGQRSMRHLRLSVKSKNKCFSEENQR